MVAAESRVGAPLMEKTAERVGPLPGSVAAILPAAGSGRRFAAARNKLFATLAGQPVWVHAAQRLAARGEVARIVLAVSAADRDTFENEFRGEVRRLGVEIVTGGRERTDSVRAGLDALADDPSIRLVAIHDAARPRVVADDLTAVFTAAAATGAAILATPIVGTIKRDLGRRENCVTVDRSDLWSALTPQVFRIDWLRRAYARYRGWPVTDDAQLLERSGYPVTLVPGRADNLKITHPEDLAIAEALLARLPEDASN